MKHARPVINEGAQFETAVPNGQFRMEQQLPDSKERTNALKNQTDIDNNNKKTQCLGKGFPLDCCSGNITDFQFTLAVARGQ